MVVLPYEMVVLDDGTICCLVTLTCCDPLLLADDFLQLLHLLAQLIVVELADLGRGCCEHGGVCAQVQAVQVPLLRQRHNHTAQLTTGKGKRIYLQSHFQKAVHYWNSLLHDLIPKRRSADPLYIVLSPFHLVPITARWPDSV
jgi:hypothetical protein